MKIYTKTGDDGTTGLFGGKRVPKNDLRIQAYGSVDQINSHLGLALATSKQPTLNTILTHLQNLLFSLGADLATPLDTSQKTASKIQRISQPHTQQLETYIDHTTHQISEQKTFILPGGSLTAAHLHVARTITRQTEILTLTLAQSQDINPNTTIFLNRLSDLLFTLARYANKLENIQDIPWISDNPQS